MSQNALIKKSEAQLACLSNEQIELKEEIESLNQELASVPANFGKIKSSVLMIAGTLVYFFSLGVDSDFLLLSGIISFLTGFATFDNDHGRDLKRTRLKTQENTAALRLEASHEKELELRFKLLEEKEKLKKEDE